MEAIYGSDLNESGMEIVLNLIPHSSRKRKNPLEKVINGMFYLLQTSCQWRNLPKTYGHWESIYYYFRQWKRDGLIEEMMDRLREMVREKLGRNKEPSLGIIDSKSVKTSHHTDAERGIDGNKKVKGRKIHLIVDILGLPIKIIVHKANIHDSKGALLVFMALLYQFPKLKKILGDCGYKGEELRLWLKQNLNIDLEVVSRKDCNHKNFKVIPKRWIVERSFAWLENYRRLTIDYEYLAESSQAMVQLAFIHIMLNKISK